MKLPVSWLKEYVDFDDTVQGLADKLTFSGVEVEGIETVGGDSAGRADPCADEGAGTPDTVLDLEITPNRPDCLSVIGIAREVAALYGSALKWPVVERVETGAPVDSLTRVEVEDPEGCPRCTARVLQDVVIGPAPDWMQRRLTLAGIRPINNVVDITNYVMLETGHPLHAFDQALLQEGRVVVRRARAGETMLTLDGEERDLSPEMLVIADAEGPVAVAGVMGGAGSEIRATTSQVVLESACFDPLLTRATSRQLALSTESSYRFERGVDAATVEWTSRRAAQLMAEHAGARVASGVVDLYSATGAERTVTCRWEFVRDLTGMSIRNAEIEAILSALGLTSLATDADSFTVRIPTFRADLERDVDVVEEVARIHGLDHVPTKAPRAEIVPGADYTFHRSRADLKAHLVGLGLREIMNYSLTAPALLDLLNPDDRERRLVLPHPISADQSVLRPSLIPQMVETIGRNHARQIPEALLFEWGRVYQWADAERQETERICIGLMGPVGRGSFDKRSPVKPPEMFGWMKGLVSRLLEVLRIDAWSVDRLAHPCLEAGPSVEILIGGEAIGVMGLLRGDVRREYRLSEPVAVAELDVAALLQHGGRIQRAQDVPVYPAVVRDMALVVDADILHAEILRVIRANADQALEQIQLFDIFEGEAIGKGRKSMAYSVTYRSPNGTLTDEDANVYHQRVKDAVRRELAVTIREG